MSARGITAWFWSPFARFTSQLVRQSTPLWAWFRLSLLVLIGPCACSFSAPKIVPVHKLPRDCFVILVMGKSKPSVLGVLHHRCILLPPVCCKDSVLI